MHTHSMCFFYQYSIPTDTGTSRHTTNNGRNELKRDSYDK